MAFKLLLLLFSTSAFAQMQTIRGQLAPGLGVTTNYIKNPSCEKNDADITDANAIVSRNGTTPLTQGGDCAIDADADAEFAEWDVTTFENELKGRSCAASLVYSGDASLYEFGAFIDGTEQNAVALTGVASGSQRAEIIFPCGDLTNMPKVRVTSTSASAAAINVAKVYIGSADGLLGTAQQAYDFGSLTYPRAASCNWSNTSVSTTTPAAFAAVADCATPSVTGLVKAPATKIPAFVIPAGSPSGVYKVNATGEFDAVRTNPEALSIFSFFDGSTHFNIQSVGSSFLGSGTTTQVFRVPNLTGAIVYETSSTDTIVEIRGASQYASATTLIRTTDGATGSPLTFNVTFYPDSSQVVVRGDVTDISGFAKSPATSDCTWSTTSATMASFDVDADCPALTTSGNAASPATKIPAFVAPTLLKGRYLVLFSGAMFSGTSLSGNQRCNYEIFDGTNSIGTTRIGTQVSTTNVFDNTIVGTVEYTSTQTNRQFQIRAQRTLGNASCSLGNDMTPITFTLIPLSQGLPKPFIPSSVFAGRASVAKVGAGKITCSSTATITSNPDSMIASIGNVSSGLCTVTLTTGYFSSTPICVANWRGSGQTTIPTSIPSDATSLAIGGFTDTGAAITSSGLDFICFGDN